VPKLRQLDDHTALSTAQELQQKDLRHDRGLAGPADILGHEALMLRYG